MPKFFKNVKLSIGEESSPDFRLPIKNLNINKPMYFKAFDNNLRGIILGILALQCSEKVTDYKLC